MSPEASDKILLIRQCYLFSDAAYESVARLAAASSVETLPRRREIFAADDPPDGLRILVSGLIRIWINDAEGRELTLSLVEPGECFGEIALLDRSARTTNATVVDKAQILLLRQSVFEAVLDKDPILARHLIVLLCDRLRKNTEDLRGFAFRDMGARLAQKLCDLAMAHADLDGDTARFTRKFSQTDLANMLGVTREAVNKRLAALCYDEILSIDAGWITILDMPGLQNLAERT
jgi:CRP/FNR family cyclic AMP-dependent transcriptional regulator